MGHANTRNLFGRYPNDIAKKYGVGVHQYTHNRQLQCINELLAIADHRSKIKNVLDCPCGSGRVAAQLSGFELTCADYSTDRVERAKKNVLSTDRFDVCDIFNLPYSDETYDLMLTVLLLQHIERSKLSDLFREIARVSRRWAIVTYSNSYQLLSILRRFKDVPNNTLSQKDFDRIASEAGFRRVSRRFIVPGIAGTTVVLLEKA